MSLRRVFIDPDGTLGTYLAVIVEHPTGVLYEQQCGGVATLQRSVEGYYVPLGGPRFDPEQGTIDTSELRAPFHAGSACLWGELSEGERRDELRSAVAAIPFWHNRDDGTEVRGHLVLNESRLGEVVEAWVPVVTPDGPGILIWDNCD
jgi:hypothetical protein